MKKFGVAFLSLMLLCFAPLWVACGETVEQIYRVKLVEFTEENIAMSVDAPPYQLEWEIEDNVALNQKVNFTSSRPEVATVSETGLVTPVKTGVTVISVQSEDNPKAKTNTCTVRVLPLKQTLATPAELKYVASTGQLTWDKVVENTAGDLIISTSSFTPKYELTINKNGSTESETKVVSSNVYADLLPGIEYQISVKALGNEYLYNDSVPTEKLNVHILDAPKNLKLTTSAEYAALEDATRLVPGDSKQIATRDYKLVFDVPADNIPSSNAEIFDYYEISLLNDRGEEVTGDARGVLDGLMAQAQILNNKFEMPINNLPAGDYFFRIKSTGSSNNVYDSVYAQTKRVRILPSPTNLVLSGENKQILSWNSVTSAVAYQILIEYKTTTDDTEQFKYSSFFIKNPPSASFDLSELKDNDGNKFFETEYTKFNIYLYALGNDANPAQTVVVDSVRSLDTARAQLSQVKNLRLSNARNSAENVELCWDTVMNAGSYMLEVFQNNNVVYSQNLNTNIITIEKDASWLTSGNYVIKVTAVPNADENYTKSIISDGLTITKLEAPVVSTLNGVLTWNSIDGVSNNISYELHYTQNGTQNITQNILNGKTTYDFGANVYNSGDYTDFYVIAKGDSTESLSNRTIDSTQPETTKTITKLRLPNKFSVESGELSLDNNVGTAPNQMTYITYLLKVYETANAQNIVYNTILTYESLNSTLNSIVSSLGKDTLYTFNLTALKTNNEKDNVLYVKSNPVETQVYLSSVVEELKAENGIITFKMPAGLKNLVTEEQGGKLVLNDDYVQDVKYLITNSANNTQKFVSAVVGGEVETISEFELQNILGGANVNVGVQVVLENANQPTVCILNSDATYSSFTKIATPTILRLEDVDGHRILKWNKTGIDMLKHEFVVKFDSNETTKVFTTPCIEIDETNEGYNQIDLSNLITGTLGELSDGTYTITLKLYPTTQTSLLVSEKSAEFSFRKLEKPTLSVENNTVLWSNQNLSGLKYDVVINDAENPITITNTQYDLTNRSGVLSIKVKAVSNMDNIISSDYSEQIVVVRFDKSDIAIVSDGVKANSITWTLSNTFVIEGQDVEVSPKKFAYSIVLDENQNNPLSSGIIEANEGTFTYTMPQNSSYKNGFYTLFVTPLGEGVEAPQSIAGVVDGDYYCFHIYKMEQLSDFAINNSNISFTKVDSTSDLPGISTQYSITVSALSDYVYVATEDQSISGNIEYPTEPSNKQVYKFKLSGSQFVIPLQKAEYTTSGTAITSDDGGLVQSLQNTITSNYVSAGSTFNLRVNTNANTRTATKEGVDYCVFDSNAALLRNITLLDAPNLSFVDGVMSWTTAKTNFEKLVFTFTPYTWDGQASRDLTPSGTLAEITYEELSNNIQSYELTKLFGREDTNLDVTKDTTNVYYRISIQSVGNNRTTISSKKITLNYVVGNLARVKINTQTNVDNPDGWYIQDGAITWKSIDGAKSYVLRFDQLRSQSDKDVEANPNIVNTQEVVYRSTGDALYTYTPDSDLRVSGYYLVSMKVIGDVFTNDTNKYFRISSGPSNIMPVYANSVYERTRDAVQCLRQLDTNNSMTVTDGELEWDNNQLDYVSKYVLHFEDSGLEKTNEQVNNTGSAKYNFVFSNLGYETSVYDVNLRALGQTWTGRSDSELVISSSGVDVVYLTSRASSSFRFRYIDVSDIKLSVTNGLFNWNIDSSLGTATWMPTYQVGVKAGSAVEFTWLTEQTTKFNELEDYANSAISKLLVKVLGDRSVGISTPLLNSAIDESLALANLKKLPDIANFNYNSVDYGQQIIINEIGDLVWNCGYGNAYQGFSTQLSISVRDGKTNAVMGQAITKSLGELPLDAANTYNYEDTGVYAGVSPIYEFGINVVGSVAYHESADPSDPTYISSNKASISARKFGSISNFTLKNGVNFVWNADKACITTYNESLQQNVKEWPTKYIIEYVSGDDFSFSENKLLGDAHFERIVFDAQYETDSTVSLYNTLAQFIDNGTYAIRLSVYKDNNSFRSTPIYCMINLDNEIDLANIYDGLVYDDGVEQDGKSYFEIESAKAIKNIKYTINSNVLAVNMQNRTQEVIGTNILLNLFNIEIGANYRMTDDVALDALFSEGFGDNIHNDYAYLEEEEYELLGIFDGGNRTISNIQTLNSAKLAWFDSIAYTGIIKDLTLSYSSIDLSNLGWTYDEDSDELSYPTEATYFGFVTNVNYGLIENCKLITYNSESEEIIHNYFDKTDNIVLGMFAGKNLTTTITNNNTPEVHKAKIVGCENSISMPLTGLSYTMGENGSIYQIINLAGIVAENNGSFVVNCVNNGNLSAYRAGGIVFENRNGAVVSGCENNGSVYVQAAKSNTNPAIAGGIVAVNYDSSIVWSLNKGPIHAWTNENAQRFNYADIGGIVGLISNTSGNQSIISNCLQTYSGQDSLQIHKGSSSVWGTINIGYLIGDKDGGTTVVENCAYKEAVIPMLDGESAEAYAARLLGDMKYYPNLILGSSMYNENAQPDEGQSYEQYVAKLKQINLQDFPSVSSLANLENAMNLLNTEETPGIDILCIEDEQKPVFVSTTNGVTMIFIDENSDYAKIQKTATQNATVLDNPGFVPKVEVGGIESDFATTITTINIKAIYYEISDGTTTSLSTTKPTSAGTYNVYVYYTLGDTFVDFSADVVFGYTYVLN